MSDTCPNELDYDRIARAIRYLEANFRRQPGLDEVAGHIGVSRFHAQRLFRRWAGISPKRFLQFVTAQHARPMLQTTHSVLDVALESGLSGPGRLHDLLLNVHGMTPGQIADGGRGLSIVYGVHASPFGRCFVAATPQGVCRLAFIEDGLSQAMITELRRDWPGARLAAEPALTGELVERIFQPPSSKDVPSPGLHVRGTNFQIRVWEALLRIPPAHVVSYGRLAAGMGSPKAARAVGSAVAANPVAVLIPCHRVIRENGLIGGYRWGGVRKKALLIWEATHHDAGLQNTR